MMNNTEQLRQSFKPDNIRMLLVGESAPASGQFFYNQSRMTGYVTKAFKLGARLILPIKLPQNGDTCNLCLTLYDKI